jgi:hypothetical protein
MEFRLEDSREILRRTPTVVSSLLRDAPDRWVTPNEGPGTWSPFDMVGHLIHAEETDWIPRARIILEHGFARPFEPFDRFAMFENSKGKALAELLETFDALRRRSLEDLDRLGLTPEDLARRGRHRELGAVTLGQLLATWTVHDLEHIGQIVRVMCKQYTEAVGPWTKYLPILDRSEVEG